MQFDKNQTPNLGVDQEGEGGNAQASACTSTVQACWLGGDKRPALGELHDTIDAFKKANTDLILAEEDKERVASLQEK
jgi:hypothetical protein